MMVQQGHRYELASGGDVLALKSGAGFVNVARIQPDQPYPLGPAFSVLARELEPLPMRYFHGTIPEARG